MTLVGLMALTTGCSRNATLTGSYYPTPIGAFPPTGIPQSAMSRPLNPQLDVNNVAPNSRPTGTVTGRVVDSVNKVGLSNARVEVQGVRPAIFTSTDASGNFTLSNVPQGRQVLMVRKPDYTNVAGNRNIVVEVQSGTSTAITKNIALVPFQASTVNGFIKAFNNFKLPRGIAIAPATDNIYVVDVIGEGGLFNYGYAEVKKLNGDGGVIDNFGGRLLSVDLFRLLRRANGVGIDSGGNVFVANTGKSAINQYGPAGQYIDSVKGGFSEVFDVAVLRTGDIVVSDPGNGRVSIFDSSFNLRVDNVMQGYTSSGLRGITTDNNDNIYILDSSARPGMVVTKFDKYGNRIPLSFGRIGGIQPGYFNNPNDLAVDPKTGDIYVVDTGNNRVQRFNSEGRYLSEFGSFGTDNGRFNAPWGIAIDKESFVYITDTKNQRVQKFAPAREVSSNQF